jgi:hypothetical protein
VNTTSKYTPLNYGLFVEIMFRTCILDNTTNWWVFNNDTQIINCLTNSYVFQYSVIDDEAHEQDIKSYQDEERKMRTICIPKNLLSLENMFDLQTKFRRPANPNTNNSTMMHFLVNLGTRQQPKYINMGTFYSRE